MEVLGNLGVEMSSFVKAIVSFSPEAIARLPRFVGDSLGLMDTPG